MGNTGRFVEGKSMLILSRREKQSILIGDDIEITICRVAGRSVRIGLQAPRDIKIIRGEVSTLDDEVVSAQDTPRDLVALRSR
jgi:carbon storage regulator